MILLAALVVGTLFGAGVYLLLLRDLVRVALGLLLVSQTAILYIVAASRSLGEAPIAPAPDTVVLSDPVTQALGLTGVVISFGVTVLVLALLYRIFASHHSLDQEDLRQLEHEERDTEPLDPEAF